MKNVVTPLKFIQVEPFAIMKIPLDISFNEKEEEEETNRFRMTSHFDLTEELTFRWKSWFKVIRSMVKTVWRRSVFYIGIFYIAPLICQDFSNFLRIFHQFPVFFGFHFQADPAKDKFLVDGFPRNQDNLDGWVKQMEDKVNLQFVLFFECPDGVCIDRCLSRGTGRSDDNIESLKKRFNVFYSETMPIVDYYEQKHLVRRVNSEKPPELVFEEVQQAFNDYDAK